MDERTRIGANIRSARLRKGMSLRVAAGLAGRSVGWLSEVERGITPLERRRDLVRVADALEISTVDLTGQPYSPTDPPGVGLEDAITLLRKALQEMPDPVLAADVDQLASEVASLSAARANLDLVAIGASTPGLVTRLKATSLVSSKVDRGRLLRMTFWTCQGAQMLARNLGYLDLAWIAAEQVKVAALELDDPTWVAAAEYSRAHALVPTGAFRAAAQYATLGADLASRTDGPEAVGAHGALLLVGAYAYGHAGQLEEAEARLTDAERLATRDTGQVFSGGMSFGPSNVALHRMQVAIEAQRPEHALQAAKGVQPGALPTAERRAAFWVDLGRANAHLKRDEAAVVALKKGEAESPYRIRLHPLAREAVAFMVQRPHSDPVGRDLRGLAYRMGVPH